MALSKPAKLTSFNDKFAHSSSEADSRIPSVQSATPTFVMIASLRTYLKGPGMEFIRALMGYSFSTEVYVSFMLRIQ